MDAVATLWAIVGNIVWSLPLPEEADALEEDAFQQYGHPYGISKSPHTLTSSHPDAYPL